jgi:hypothetical protein
VRRLDLLGDDELDRFRALHPERSVVALDAAVALEETLEAALRERGLAGQLEALPMRPVLATFVCFACGAAAIGEDVRAWDVDREMQRTGRSERDVLRERD